MKRRVDYGSLIFLLVFLILGIFVVDFVRRRVIDMRGLRKEPEIVSTTSDNISTDEPITTTAAVGGNHSIPSVTNADSGVVTDVTTTAAAPTGDKTISVPANDVHTGSLILVDSAHPLTSTPETTAFLNITYDHFRLPTKNLTINNMMIEPLVSMFNDFYKVSNFGNTMIYCTMNSTTAAAYSAVIPERLTGLTMDLAVWDDAVSSHTPFTGTDKFAWFPQHAAEYGFVLRFADDKTAVTGQPGCTWHYRYVGVPPATYMPKENLCLEEYLELLKNEHSYDKQHLMVDAGGTSYEVYYYPAAVGATATDISVPADAEAVISGDNLSGYIITVQRGGAAATTPDPDDAAAETTTTEAVILDE